MLCLCTCSAYWMCGCNKFTETTTNNNYVGLISLNFSLVNMQFYQTLQYPFHRKKIMQRLSKSPSILGGFSPRERRTCHTSFSSLRLQLAIHSETIGISDTGESQRGLKSGWLAVQSVISRVYGVVNIQSWVWISIYYIGDACKYIVGPVRLIWRSIWPSKWGGGVRIARSLPHLVYIIVNALSSIPRGGIYRTAQRDC